MKSFSERLARADERLLKVLNDGLATLYDKHGTELASNMPITLDLSVEHPSNFTGRTNIITFNRREVPRYDPNGLISHAGVMWRIDNILKDDGYLVECAVVDHDRQTANLG